MTFVRIIATSTLLAASAMLCAPSHADKIKSGTAPQGTKQTGTVSPPKGIDAPGGQSGGIKSGSFDPVSVTFPKTTSRSQPSGGTFNRIGGGQRR